MSVLYVYNYRPTGKAKSLMQQQLHTELEAPQHRSHASS